MTTLTLDRPVHLVRYAKENVRPIVIDTGLVASATGTAAGASTTNAEAAHILHDHEALNALRAKLRVDRLLLRRLVGLWNIVAVAGADEIGDGAVQADVQVTSVLLPVTLTVRAVGVTVFADGQASFSVVIDGMDTPLWLAEQLDLSTLVDSGAGA